MFQSDEKTLTSVIDHFLWSEDLLNSVIDAGVIHLPENQSDHEPVYCRIILNDMEEELGEEGTTEAEDKTENKPSWKRARSGEKENFIKNLSTNLVNIHVPMEGTNANKIINQSINQPINQ